ncbi:MAG: acyl-ACP--UDP-N-acetylglucosamine O-acyltransferase [Odoribacter sp.]
MISPLAYIDTEAKLGKNVTVHPFAYIDKNVEIGDNCTIMPYASILSGTRMGVDNIVYQGAIIGATPQDFKFKGEDTLLKIGNHNTIREKVIINRGTNTTDCTIVGNGNFLLEGVHLAHDTHLGNNCVLGNGAKTTGNCVIDDCAILGNDVILKHGCHVGSWALLKDGCRANKDVPPFIVAAHNPITYYGINAVILSKEKQLPETIIDDIAKAYRQIYQCSTSLENAIRRIKEIIPLNPEISYLIEFIENSKKGIIGVNM